jgi:hypothetical protein
MGHGWDAGGTKRGARKGRRARTTPSGYWPLTARPLVLSHGDGSVPPNGIGPPRGHLFGDELDGPGLGLVGESSRRGERDGFGEARRTGG